MTTSLKYGATAKWLHWLIGFIAILMLILGRTMESLPLDERAQIIMGHSGLGTLVLLLMIARLTWRGAHPPPGPTEAMSAMQVRLSRWMHGVLYGLLILQPLLGLAQAMYVTDYEVVALGLINYSSFAQDDAGLAQTFHILHGLNATILSVLVVGHITAALYHHFRQKDAVLRRMLPFGKIES